MDNNQEYEPEDIRADLWPTMNTVQLSNQRDKIVSKMSLLHSMNFSAMPTARGLYVVLSHALEDINALIASKQKSKK